MEIGSSLIRFVTASLVMASTTICAQTIPERRYSALQHKIKSEVIQYEPGVVTNVLVSRNGTPTVNRIDMTKQVNLIVEFRGEPMFLQKYGPTSPKVPLSSYIQRQTQFQSDLVSLHTAAVKGLKVTLSTPIVTREYSKAFYGAAVTVPRAMVPQIASLSYVKRLFADRKVKALLVHSVHQVRADSVWKKFGAQGKGVLVGEIDTGIDYDDSALGGGIGPGYKVVGGYNFINNSTNPMDDNGHGTHVAGIIAADGANLKGVAPLAKLMAFKALDQNGIGTESNVIAAIERCADPNNDGNDSDKVDIVNMSLGGSGGPDDAMSAAVDSAVELGITFCVAAGNSGFAGYYNIDTPGTARLAITVGAVDSTDNLAPFSSKGPDGGICIIKPDIVAPGVNITSTYLNNTEATYSGTSMATPFVTGVCALLKSLHKNWSPATIKSAIMTTAVDIGQEVMAQGAGRVDALNAAEVSAFAYPPDLSFGFDSSAANDWTEVDTMWVANSDSVSQSFSMSFDNVPTGVNISASPSTFSLASGDSEAVVISLSVDNSVVPYPEKGSLAYSGFAHLDGTRDTLHMPWAFVKAARVMLAFDKPDPMFLVSNSKVVYDYMNATWNGEYNAELVLPKGKYDIVGFFMGPDSYRMVVEEQVALDSVSTDSVLTSDATNLVTLAGVGPGGEPLKSLSSSQNFVTLRFPDSSQVISDQFDGAPDSILCSDLSDRFTLAFGQAANDGLNKAYNVQFDTLAGLRNSMTLTNNPSDFYTQKIHTTFPPYAGMTKQVDCINWSMVTDPGVMGFGLGMDTKITGGFKGDWSGTLYLTPNKSLLNNFGTSFGAYDGPQSSPYYFEYQLYASSPAQVYNDSIAYFFEWPPPTGIHLFPDGGQVTFGNPPFCPGVLGYNNLAGKSNIYIYTVFQGPLDEDFYLMADSSAYTIYNNQNAIVASGTQSAFPSEGVDVPAGQYRYKLVNNDYYIRGVRGSATVTSRFDLGNSYPDPPSFTSMSLLNGSGLPVDSLSQDEKGTLTFSASSASIVPIDSGKYNIHFVPLVEDSTRLFYKMHDSTDWIPLSITTVREDSDGGLYNADITPTTLVDSSAVDIRINVRDQGGNTTQWVMEPAYFIGNYGTATAIKENQAANNIPKVFALYQNYPNPFNPSTTIKYDLPRATHVSLIVYNILGQEVANIVDATQQPGHYTVSWNGNTRAGLAASGVYFVRLEAGDFVKTIKMLLLK